MEQRRLKDVAQPSAAPGSYGSALLSAAAQERFEAGILDQTGLAALFSTVATPAAVTGADLAGGALQGGATYKWEVTALGPMGESQCLTANELSRAQGAAPNNASTLTLTQVAGAVAYRIYVTIAGGSANTETLCCVVPRPGNVVNGSTFTYQFLGTEPRTNVIPNRQLDTTTLPTALGAPGSAITGATGATLAGSTLPLLSALQYKYTAVNFLGETPASAASATFTLTGTQNKFGGITLTAVTGAQYYNIYRAQVVGGVAGTFTYLCTVNADNSTNNQVLTTFVDDGNYKGSTKTPPTVDGTGGAVAQPIGTSFISPYFASFGPGGANWHPNCVNGQQVLGLSYGVSTIPAQSPGLASTGGSFITPGAGQEVSIVQAGVVTALVNTAANYTGALTGGTLGTTVMGPLSNTVIPGTPLQLDGCGHLCPVGFYGNAGTAGIVQGPTLPGQVVGYALGTVGINQIQAIQVLLGDSV